MTIEQMMESRQLLLNAADIAEVLGVDAQDLRVQARDNPAALGFPVTRIGKRTLIPRIPFLRHLGMEGINDEKAYR